MTRTILCENDLPKYFWAEATNTACYILNRTSIRPILKKTLYELWKERKPNISYFRAFGCKCFIHNNGKDQLGKFDSNTTMVNAREPLAPIYVCMSEFSVMEL
ncbi:hypothetical protein CFOL_v3_05503 [Cephalotus follicularis]|uniref:Uncharacterized protein n=1 Tax=Cephalotus follicularis TaxID=3775 RepID=A0A1Q3B1Z2_CEPFO|nr:hypothetical protein CFOL_v3_05503 [Cephalotus follicularis]